MSGDRSLGASVLLAALILYLGANVLTGQDGLVSWFRLQAQERVLLQQRAALQERRVQLLDRVGRLRPESLDLDYLEERARVLLAARRPGEIAGPLPEAS